MIDPTMTAEATTAETTISETMPGSLFAGLSYGREIILLVEDEAFVRKVAADVLESAGYRVLTARSAEEALEVSRGRSEPVDLLLSDVVMPGMSGNALAVKFEALCPSARILLMSGHAEEFAGCDLRVYGKKYLAKPFSVSILLKRVRQALDSNPHN